ncbi:DUF3459 domain-containing protein [Novosphingobium panipatense]
MAGAGRTRRLHRRNALAADERAEPRPRRRPSGGRSGLLLHLTRRLVALRSGNASLRRGSCEVVVADETHLVLRRALDGQSVLTVFNMGPQATPWPAGVPTTGEALAAVNDAEAGTLPAWGGIWIIEGETA